MSERLRPRIFKAHRGTLLPDEMWATVVDAARQRSRSNEPEHDLSTIMNLGRLIGGAATMLRHSFSPVGVELSDFAGTAEPPMSEAEADALRRGYIEGCADLLTPAWPPDLEVQP